MRLANLILLLVLLIQGCGLPTPWRTVSGDGGNGASRQLPDSQARQLANRGDYLGAAQAYLRLANQQGQSETALEYRMNAVEYLLRANREGEARKTLDQLRRSKLSPRLQQRLQLALARLELADGKPGQAQQRLEKVGHQGLPSDLHATYYRVYALALEAEQRYLDAARARAMLDGTLRTSLEVRTNQQALWQDLLRLPPAQLSSPPGNVPDPFRGWLELARTVRAHPPSDVRRAVNEWRRSYPNHAAERSLVASLLEEDSPLVGGLAGAVDTRHIALILPLNGDFKRAAETVRDGFLAAWYQQGREQGIGVKIYNSLPENVAEVYQAALDEGATLVVGPLTKNGVNALVNLYAQFPVPTLTLNYHVELSSAAAYTPPANLYQFSLSAEDEARVVAALAWSDGHRRAAALVPEGDWGTRVLNAFSLNWNQMGGEMVTHAFFHKNFSQAAREIANQRRQLDMLFVGAFPAQARQILPQLKYQYAGNLPVYATSHVFSGTPDAGMDKDLNGIRFVDMPWLLTPPPPNNPLYAPLAGHWQNMPAANKRLYAFGIDAYRLVNRLADLRQQSSARLEGETGMLWIDRQGIVHRELPEAVFSNGLPVMRNEMAEAASSPPQPGP